MTAILRRELSAYFYSPIGYIYLTVFYAFSGLFFSMSTLAYQMADITPVFSQMFTIVLFLIPILTMRLLSEDKKNKTDQALLTAPVSLTGLAIGKYLAAVLVYVVGLAVTVMYGVIINYFTMPNWALIWGNFLALLLIGMALISIGMFISALTENQVIAAVGGFAVGFFLLVLDSLSSLTSNTLVNLVVQNISFSRHYSSFADGIFDLADIFFFLAVSTIFVFLTVRILEKRRWS
jgi:ABC-2 type transport system permease protein